MTDSTETKGKKKKGEKMPLPDTPTSAPLRGANQDYSGVNPNNDVADYTISDGFVAGVGAVRATPIQMSTTPRGRREKNAPRNIGAMQRAADRRRMQLDRIAQKRTTAQKVAKEKMISKRQHDESLSLINLAQKVGKESKIKMPKDKVSGAFLKFSDFVKEEIELDEAHKLNDPVEIIKGSGKGIKGHIGEIRHGSYKGAPKTYTVFHGENGAIQVGKEHIRKLKEEIEIEEEEAELDEARRGRPRKGEGEDQETSNIIMQLRKVISLRGQAPVRFLDGKQSMMSPATAHRLLYMYDNLKTSGEKHSFAQRIHKSADSLRDTLAGKKEVVKPKITLAGKFHD